MTIETRRKELLARLAKGTTDQAAFDELMTMNRAEEATRAEREAQVENVRTLIRTLNIQLDEIRSAFSAALARVSKAAGKPRGVRKTGNALIANVKTRSGKGAPSSYHQGQKIPQYVPKAFKELADAHPNDFESALKPYFTPAGAAYFATEAGKAELNGWMQFAKQGKTSPK